MTAKRCPVAPRDPDLLDPPARDAWFAHLDRCEGCAHAWDAEDPTRAFRVLRDEPLPADLLESVSRAVVRAIDVDALADRARGRRAWMATAAAALLGAALGWTAFRQPPRPSATVARTAAVDAIRANDDHAHVRLTSSSDEVRIVDLTVGGNQVVMIFDERMQL